MMWNTTPSITKLLEILARFDAKKECKYNIPEGLELPDNKDTALKITNYLKKHYSPLELELLKKETE